MRITDQERRSRLWHGHHLAAPAGGEGALLRVVRDLVALHATDPASIFLGLRARAASVSAADVERALYEDRILSRILAMRRTMFVTDADRLPVLHASSGLALADVELRRNLQLLELAGVAEPEAWHERVAELTLEALRAAGHATALQLTEAVPELGLQVAVGKGKWAGKIGMSSRMLLWLAIVGQVSRARPQGSWKSTMYVWAPTREWLGIDLEERAPDPAVARTELARCYLAAFGPATFEDLRWWTGWNKTQTRKALAGLEPLEVALECGPGLMLAADAPGDAAWNATGAPVEAADPDRVVFLPPLDTTIMGWKERGWYLDQLGELEGPLFDRSGNAGPTVWHAGRVIGGWAHRIDGKVAWRLLVDRGDAVARAAEREAAGLEEWLGEVQIVPRFRTGLEKELLE